MVHKCKKLLLSMIVMFCSISAKIKKQCDIKRSKAEKVEVSCGKESENRSLSSWMSVKVDGLKVWYSFVLNLITGHKEDVVAEQEASSQVVDKVVDQVVGQVENSSVELVGEEVAEVMPAVDMSVAELVEQVKSRAAVSVPEDYSAVAVNSELVLSFTSFYEKLENEVITVSEKVVDGQRCFEVSQVSQINNDVCLSVVYHVATPAGLSIDPSKVTVVDRENPAMIVIHVPVVKDARASSFSPSPLRIIVSLCQNV